MISSPYQRMGGEAVVRGLVDHFYDGMDSQAEFATIRTYHSESLDHARSALFDFLSGWLGGPQLYVEKYGHPRLRQRHLPFSIGVTERDQWLACMSRAMQKTGLDEKIQTELQQSFFKTADFMRNQQEGNPVERPFIKLAS